MHKYTLVTDCDGVLVSWFSQIKAFLESKGRCTNHLDVLIAGNPYNSHELLFPAKTKEESYSLFDEYNNSHFISKLTVLEKESIKAIYRISKMVNIVVVTNLSKIEESQERRKLNIDNIYGDIFKEVHCLPPFSNKTEKLIEVSKGEEVIMWIDDCVHHVQEGIKAGIKDSYQFTYGMKCGRNTGEVASIGSWLSIEQKISDILAIKTDQAC